MFEEDRWPPNHPPAQLLQIEHRQIDAGIEAYTTGTGAGAETALDDSDATTVAAAAEHLLAVLGSHNAKEEPVLYPHISDAVGADAASKLVDFIESGSMPEGWVCATARPLH
ncbi:MAG: hypothetical protein GX610_03540 [Rhodococcus sp.]|nr:hypothetical protein [Rhodococcus sp. (in: high G+C Gram-positive bacteria)]